MEIDVIGIFLPPAPVLAEREQAHTDTAPLKTAEDAAVRDIVERQLLAGLKTVTSGGIRWRHWDKDFFFGLSGIEKERIDSGHVFHNDDVLTDLMRFKGRIAFNPHHPFFDDFRFLAATTADRAVCRQIIPSPAELYVDIMISTDGHPETLYPASEHLIDDISEAYRHTILRFYELGCRSLILDDTVCGRLCETNFTKRLLQGGIDIVSLHESIIELFNRSLAGVPSGMEAALYLTGGDTVVPEWRYVNFPDNIMHKLLPGVHVDKFHLPFNINDEHVADVLHHIPHGKKVVLGLSDAHSPWPDDEDAIQEIASTASRIIPGGRLAISPRTGFMLSSYASRGLSYEDQWRKIGTLAELARTI